MAKSNSKKKPVHEIRFGRVRAAIWENETEQGVMHNVTMTRLYKDGDSWKDTTSFGRDDLPVASPKMMWSSTVIPINFPASVSCSVTARSSLLGVASPEGWL